MLNQICLFLCREDYFWENSNNFMFSEPSPIWVLSVKWKMEGIEVNLDTTIGKWLNKLADTVTRLADTQNRNNEV